MGMPIGPRRARLTKTIAVDVHVVRRGAFQFVPAVAGVNAGGGQLGGNHGGVVLNLNSLLSLRLSRRRPFKLLEWAGSIIVVQCAS
jgi:hypothetical protein